jgi:hypothetical protein
VYFVRHALAGTLGNIAENFLASDWVGILGIECAAEGSNFESEANSEEQKDSQRCERSEQQDGDQGHHFWILLFDSADTQEESYLSPERDFCTVFAALLG